MAVGEEFGRLGSGEVVRRFTLENAAGLRVRVLTYGAAVQSLEVPGADGESVDVVLGYGTLDEYVAGSSYFGATVGRYANRIAGGRFELDGREYRLHRNEPAASLHGGREGFDKKVWEVAEATDDSLTLTYLSPDGEEGYPGAVEVHVTYALSGDALRIDLEAASDAPTVVNLTHHGYFDLSGGQDEDVLGHVLHMDAARYLPTDADLIPTGELAPVVGTPFDFTAPQAIGVRIDEPHPDLMAAGGYDHCYVLDDGAVTVTHPGSGRTMEMTTDAPAVQFYSGNFLDGSTKGPSGRPHRRRSGFCLEPQHFPDSPNRPEFPSTVLRPGGTYASSTVFRFPPV
ncbi:aldose epimerase family protein [Actinomadura parmotrematis]|uniref:Aldose 1-epimerase n=1 Tax=Actinomadura parmotrematis TaxID=2864039 RepID=A0ABS7FNQ0_9ACTN|nr:aldose epimerase family protein [Actinomadura parmotrematis]MBW8481404.1 galactose mutarotase [Actinomadura parmotrematis]